MNFLLESDQYYSSYYMSQLHTCVLCPLDSTRLESKNLTQVTQISNGTCGSEVWIDPEFLCLPLFWIRYAVSSLSAFLPGLIPDI